jgi:hypothetical protein
MNELRMRRWMGPIGLLVPVLIVVAFGPLGGGAPGENASGVSVVNYYNAHMTRQWIVLYLVAVALAAMLVFVTQLRGVLRDTERSRSVLPGIAYGAGLLFVGGFLASGMIQLSLLLAAHNNEFAIAKTLNFIGSNTELPVIFSVTVLLAATGLCILRSSLPKWLGWLTLVIAVVCLLGPIGFLGVLAAGIWIPVMGFVAGFKATSTPPATPPEVPAVPEVPTAPAPGGTLVH